MYADGLRAGATLGESGCLDRAVARHAEPDYQSILESVRTNLVLRGCLEASRAGEELCDGVQGKDDLIAHATWAAQRCAIFGFTDAYCPQMMGQLAEYCSSPKRDAKLPRRH